MAGMKDAEKALDEVMPRAWNNHSSAGAEFHRCDRGGRIRSGAGGSPVGPCRGSAPGLSSWKPRTDVDDECRAESYGVGRVSANSGGETDLAAYWGVENWEPFVEDCIVDTWTNEQPARALVCPVSRVAAYNPDPYPLDTAKLTQGTRTALTCLQNAVGAAMGTLTVTSAYRPQAYQNHLREVWDKWQAIKDRTDAACADTKAQVQTEWNRHDLAFQPALVSDHSSGTAFDANWTPGTLNIGQLATGCNLSRPVPGDDHHFVYGGG
jgi:hypothetical protein